MGRCGLAGLLLATSFVWFVVWLRGFAVKLQVRVKMQVQVQVQVQPELAWPVCGLAGRSSIPAAGVVVLSMAGLVQQMVYMSEALKQWQHVVE